MTLDDLTKLIQTVGFPIFVAVWFMFRLERRQDKILELLYRAIGEDEAEAKKDKEGKHGPH